jgi:phosphoglycerate dehydrogenase-like enzyme
MSVNVAILHKTGDILKSLLTPDFPEVSFSVVPVISEAKVLPPEAEPLLPEADAIISIGRWMTPEILAKCGRLRWFQCILTGVDHLLGPLAGSKVVLTNARGIHGRQMAELTLLHMMAAYRQVPALVKNQANHAWDRIRPRVLDNRTVVILGVGLIAEQVARLCKAVGMKTIGISRTPRHIEGFDRIEPRDRLLETVAEADFVVVLVPLIPENEKLVDAKVFAAMKPSAYLINVARGKIVDEEALIEAVRTGQIAGAGIDVFEKLPLPPDSPLWDLENVFITPHIGGQSDQYEENLISILKPNLEAFLAGQEVQMVNLVPLSQS